MSTYTAQIDAALDELRAWRSTARPDDATLAQAYDVVGEELRNARDQENRDTLYENLASLNRFICDQAPLSADFVPSFKLLFLQLHDERPRDI